MPAIFEACRVRTAIFRKLPDLLTNSSKLDEKWAEKELASGIVRIFLADRDEEISVKLAL